LSNHFLDEIHILKTGLNLNSRILIISSNLGNHKEKELWPWARALLNYHSKVGDDSDLIRFTFVPIFWIKMAECTAFSSRWSMLNESYDFKALDSATTTTKDVPSCILGEYVCIIFWIITAKAVPTKTVPTKQYQHYT
jgi:hypothetical protein